MWCWKFSLLYIFGKTYPIPFVIAVLYENETHEDSIKDDKMRIIEMEKPRPQVFSSNLLQKTIVSQDKSSSTTVKPSGLG